MSLYKSLTSPFHSFLTDFLEKCQTKSFENEYSTFCNFQNLYHKSSLLLSSYQFIIGKIENPYCSACRHSSQDTSHLILHCPATDSLRRSLFGDSLQVLVQTFGSCRILGLDGFPPCPHHSEGSSTTTAKLKLQTHNYATKGVSKFRRS